MQTETVEQRVGNGAALLDRLEPGWVGLITRPINMASHEDCPIGQVYGRFDDHRNQVAFSVQPDVKLGSYIEREEAVHNIMYQHGFYCYPYDDYPYDENTYDAYCRTTVQDLEWEKAIVARRT